MSNNHIHYLPPVAKMTDRPGLLTMPEQHLTVHSKFKFTESEMENIRYGLIPEHMGNRWFIYVTSDNVVNFHRSWTGIHIYQIQLHSTTEGWVAEKFTVNRDPTQYNHTDVKEDKETLLALFGAYLVRPREEPLPEFYLDPKDS
jgi:hypothetical protein